jgi:hypothetical protein
MNPYPINAVLPLFYTPLGSTLIYQTTKGTEYGKSLILYKIDTRIQAAEREDRNASLFRAKRSKPYEQPIGYLIDAI